MKKRVTSCFVTDTVADSRDLVLDGFSNEEIIALGNGIA